MSHPMEFWADYRASYESRDWNECAVRLGRFVDAYPFNLTARQALGWLCLKLDQPGRALLHYDKLIPLAVGAGDLFRVLAVQRRIDAIDPGPRPELRYAAIQRWFRLLGVPALATLPSTNGRGLSALALLRLTPEVFVAAATRATLGSFEPGTQAEPAEGGDQWNLVWGSARWRLVAKNGRVIGESPIDEGDSIQADRTRLRHGRLLWSGDTPGEWLRFGAELLALLELANPQIGGDPLFESEIIREERVLIPPRAVGPSDLDHSARVATPPTAPPSLAPGPEPDARERDTGDWVEFGALDLGGAAATGGIEVAGSTGSAACEDRELDLTGHATGFGPASPAEASPSPPSAPGTLDLRGEDRRSRRRVPVGFTARLSLLGLDSDTPGSLQAEVFDLSIGGVGVRFPKQDLQRALAMVENETLKLDIVSHGAMLQVAGRVRWFDFGRPQHVAAGIQFVLLTERDREALARLVIESDPGIRAAREASQRTQDHARDRAPTRAPLDRGTRAA